jgi:hypothetical protein
MANNEFYSKIVPDFRNPDQTAVKSPGLHLQIVERDVGIGIGLSPIDAHPTERMAFVNIGEAEEIVGALQAAIRLARQKLGDDEDRPRRARDA